MLALNSNTALDTLLKNDLGVIAYFSHDKCSVCKTLKPKLSAYFTEHFEKMTQVYVNIEELPELAAKYSVFTVPVVIIFFEGSETYRKARSFGIEELAKLVERPYKIIFE